MAMSDRETVIHGSMDRLVGQVRSWRASWPAAGPNSNSELCSAHKDDIYRFFRDSGLQPWEFHTMLHRASEYGLVDDMKGLWQEVATTFLQLRSGHATDLPLHNRPGAAGSAGGQGPISNISSNGGSYAGAWPANGRSSSSGGGYAKPPGLDPSDRSGAVTPPGMRQQQQYGVPPPPPVSGARSPADDTSAASSDQQSGRKQQQQAGKKGGKQQQQQQANGPAGSGNAASSQQQERAGGAAAANSKPTGSDAMPNDHISAWRNNITAAAVGQAALAFAGLPGQQQRQVTALAGFTGSSSSGGVDQQQQQQGGAAAGSQGLQQGSTAAAAAPAGASSGAWEVQEPLDLLPSGLLDDVYDQDDAVVDAPPAYAAMANGTFSGSSADRAGSSSGGSNAAQAGQGAGKGGKQQQGKRQQKQQQQQQNQQQSQAGAAAGSSEQQGTLRQQQGQQQQLAGQVGQQQHQGMPRPLTLDAAFSGPLMPAARYSALELSSPLSMMQHQQRPAFDALAAQSQQQQQQLLVLQQQARMYQQQFAGLGTWVAAGHMGGAYGNAFGAMPAPPPPPPPPPRGAAGSVQAPAAAPAGPAAAAGAGAPSRAPAVPQQQQPPKQGYAAVAAAAAAAAAAPAQKNAAPGAPRDRAIGGPKQPTAAAAHSHSSQSIAPSLYQPVQPSNQQQQQQMPQQSSQQQHSGPAAGQQAPAGLSLFQTASYDSPVTPPLAAGPLSPYPSPLHRSLSASAGASPALQAIGTAAAAGSSSNNGLQGFASNSAMAPMLLPPSAASLGVIGEPVYGSSAGSSGSYAAQMAAHQQQQHDMLAGAAAATGDQPVHAWSFGGAGAVGTGPVGPAAHIQQQQQQQQGAQLPDGSFVSVSVLAADSSTCSAASSVTAATAASVATTPHSQAASPACSSNSCATGTPAAAPAGPATTPTATDAARQPPPPPPRTSSGDQQQTLAGSSATTSPQQQQQQPPPAPPPKPMTWAQKLLSAKQNSAAATPAGPTATAAAASPAAAHPAGAGQPRIAPAPKSELLQQQAQRAGSTGQALLAAARQQEAAAEAAAARAVPTFSETAALDGLDAVTAKAAVSAASRMPLPSKLINAWRSGLCLASLVKLLQAQRPDLATALNDRIKGWLTQDCDRSTAECLVLFVLVNLRRDWHVAAKSPGAFLMALLQHRAALIGGSGMGRKLLETARNFPNVAVYIDSDVLQELGDMEPGLRCFVMDEYMCKQRHDWPEGLKFPSQCLLSCMRSIRYADPAVHKAYASLMESRPDLAKAMNGVILYGLCKCDAGTGLAAVKRLSELPEEWTAAARVNASAFLYQKVQELCGSHGY